jgi:ABC-type sugar transport system ATPase subunit
LTRWGILRRHPESVLVDQQIQSLMIRTDARDVPAGTLSGGNQQKLVLAKWLVSNPRVLLLDEPTRGVDIGAKTQIHSLIRQLAADGMAVFVISSDMPELLAVCDRILVLREGVLSGESSAAEADQNELLEMSLPDSEAGVRV